MADVFPPRGLPGRAEEWGRQIENRIESGEASEEQLEQKVDNGLRATGGQLAVLSKQMERILTQQEELSLGRRSFTVGPSPVNLSATTPGVYPTFTRSFTIPGPYEVTRSSTMSVTAGFRRTSASGNMTIWTELLRDSDVIWRRTGAVVVGTAASAPPAWNDMGYSDTFHVVTPPGDHTYTLRFYTHTFVAELVEGVAEGLSVTASYGDPA